MQHMQIKMAMYVVSKKVRWATQLGIAGAGLMRILKDRVFDIKSVGEGRQTQNKVYWTSIQGELK